MLQDKFTNVELKLEWCDEERGAFVLSPTMRKVLGTKELRLSYVKLLL